MELSFEPFFRFAAAASSAPASCESEAAQLDRLAASARAAERAGLERVWIECAAASAAPLEALRLATAVGVGTSSLRIAAVAVEPTRTPWIRLAEDAATADGLLGGRLEIALASAPEAAWLARVREGWCGAPAAVRDSESADGGPPLHIEIHPRPFRPDGPPLWVRVADAQAARAAAARELCIATTDLALAAAYAASLGNAFGLELALDLVAIGGSPGRETPEALRAAFADTAEALAPIAATGWPKATVRVPVSLDPGEALLAELAELAALR